MDQHARNKNPLILETQRALANALAFPGRVFHLPLGDVSTITGLATIADSILSAKTTFYTPQADLRTYFSRTGAKFIEAPKAACHFYPQVNPEHIHDLASAFPGTASHPETAARVFIGCKLRAGKTLRLKGAGIPEAHQLQVSRVAEEVWEARQRVIQHPLGWDAYLVDGRSIVGLPRSVIVTVD